MTIQTPVPDYSAARASMVDTQLRPEGVNYPPVVEAMASVKREVFVAENARAVAYVDRSVPMGDGRSLSGPVVIGKLLTTLTPLAGERALVVGCGTGYSAAILKVLGLSVLGLESSPKLAARARELGIDVVEGPLEEGWKSKAPYHLILIDGAVEFIPETIISQLTDHGRLGTALIDRGICRLAIGRRSRDGFGVQTMADSGAAALPGFRKPRTFIF
jgi:protein-L-isoaspartate(D-aspartate) O-methyltransferase